MIASRIKLFKIFKLLTREERIRSLWLLLLVIIVAVLELFSIASILPFVYVLTNTSEIYDNAYLNYFFDYFNFSSIAAYQLMMGGIVFLVLTLSLSLKAWSIKMIAHFNHMCEHGISTRLISNYLNRDYEWFLSKNSSEMGAKILSEVGAVVGGGLTPLMTLISQSFVAASILSLLMFVNPHLALTVMLSLGLAYAVIYNFFSVYLKKTGISISEINKMRFSSVGETFGAVKEIKLRGIESSYIKRFSFFALNYAELRAKVVMVGQLPRYLLEGIAFGGVLLLILYLLSVYGDFKDALPIISLYILSGYRLMPALQNIYASLTQIKISDPLVDGLLDEIYSVKISLPESKISCAEYPAINKIVLSDVCYKYPNSNNFALSHINLEINANSSIAFVGSTGCGKSTLVDIVMGLLRPTSGVVSIGNSLLSAYDDRLWRSGVGYVPQQIYLSDDSIINNIAFGSSDGIIDFSKVEFVSKIAKLHDFVDTLPMGYSTFVGERGVRLSGGQRQRIGIARALYNKPKILVLDEATSALDNITEKFIIDSLNSSGEFSIKIFIAHRLSTIQNCDVIYLIENGKIISGGSYGDLISSCPKFRKLASLGS